MELSTNSLMIGNYLLHNNNIVFVAEIFQQKVRIFDGLGLDEIVFIDELNPIRLSESIYEKFGFQEGRTGYYYKDNVLVTVEGQVYFGETETWMAEIAFAHQLQNTYYVLNLEALSYQTNN